MVASSNLGNWLAPLSPTHESLDMRLTRAMVRPGMDVALLRGIPVAGRCRPAVLQQLKGGVQRGYLIIGLSDERVHLQGKARQRPAPQVIWHWLAQPAWLRSWPR